MDAETENVQLKARVLALEMVHSALIGNLAHMTVALMNAVRVIAGKEPSPGLRTEKLLEEIRAMIKLGGTGANEAIAENMKLTAEQYVDEAFHRVQEVMKGLESSRT